MSAVRYCLPVVAIWLATVSVTLVGGHRQPMAAGGSNRSGIAGRYHGPVALGPFQMDGRGRTDLAKLLKPIGNPPRSDKTYLCFRNPGSRVYLWIERASDDHTASRGICISRVKNCLGRIRPAANFEHWVTEKGIGLGSREDQVLKAYGQPTERVGGQRNVRALFDLFGGRIPSSSNGVFAAGSSISVLEYSTSRETEDLTEADFGIEGGVVIWIRLYNDE